MSNKGPLALRTISETAEILGVATHVLRFWETKFTFIRPTKRAGGRRFYRPQDLELLLAIKTLLHDRGLTLKGVVTLYKEQGLKGLMTASGIADSGLTQAMLDNDDCEHDLDEEGDEEADDGAFDHEAAKRLSDDTRRAFYEIIESLERAQQALGRVIYAQKPINIQDQDEGD